MKSLLSKFKLHYEYLESEEAERRINERTKSLKLKKIKDGWLAQVRLNRKIQGRLKRVEYAQIAPTHQEAVAKLDKQLKEVGAYDEDS